MSGKFDNILDQWWDNRGKISSSNIVPSPYAYFIQWLIQTNNRTIVNVYIEDKYHIYLQIMQPGLILIVLLGNHDAKVTRTFTYTSCITLDEIEKRFEYRIDRMFEKINDITSGMDMFKSCFIQGNDNIYTINEQQIINEISSIFQLDYVSSDFTSLKTNFKYGLYDAVEVMINLKSTIEFSKNHMFTLKMYKKKLCSTFNKFLRYGDLKCRADNVKFNFLFGYDRALTLNLTISISCYSNEDYYSPHSYGYYELAISNICNGSIGSSPEHISLLAKELNVEIHGLEHDKICEALWMRFYELTSNL